MRRMHLATLAVLFLIPGLLTAQEDGDEPGSRFGIHGAVTTGFTEESSLSSPAAIGLGLEMTLGRIWAVKLEHLRRRGPDLDRCSRNELQYSCKDTETVNLLGIGFRGPELLNMRPYAEALSGYYSAGTFSGPEFPVVALGTGIDLRGAVFDYRLGVRHVRSVAGETTRGSARASRSDTRSSAWGCDWSSPGSRDRIRPCGSAAGWSPSALRKPPGNPLPFRRRAAGIDCAADGGSATTTHDVTSGNCDSPAAAGSTASSPSSSSSTSRTSTSPATSPPCPATASTSGGSSASSSATSSTRRSMARAPRSGPWRG